MKLVIRDKEAGNIIEEVDTLDEAEEIVRDYELADKADGNFTEDFYEICVKIGKEIIALENLDYYYVVELVEYEHYNNKINYNIIADSWNRLETFSKDKANKEAVYLLSICNKYQGVYINYYNNNLENCYSEKYSINVD